MLREGVRIKKKDIKLLFDSYAQVQKMEAKVNTNADQLSNLMLFMKKGQSELSNEHPSGRPCIGQPSGREHKKASSYFSLPGQGGTCCPLNQNETRNARTAGRLGAKLPISVQGAN